jgi:methyl-accepting chemotaxis protein
MYAEVFLFGHPAAVYGAKMSQARLHTQWRGLFLLVDKSWSCECINRTRMTLKAKLILTTTLFVVVLFGVSEWLNYRANSAFITQCKEMLEARVDHPVLLLRLEEAQSQMLARVTKLRIAHAAVTLLVAVAVLNLLWYRLILLPIRQILSHINVMGRGTWTGSIPVRRKDEIGQLALAFNELSGTLNSTIHQFAAASKLSALALLGTRMVRKINLAKDHVNGVMILLKVARQRDRNVPKAAIDNLQFTAGSLEELKEEFETQFQQEFLRHAETIPNSLRSSDGTAVPRKKSHSGKPVAISSMRKPAVLPPVTQS